MSGCLIGNKATVLEFYFGTKARLSAHESGPLGDGHQSACDGPYFAGGDFSGFGLMRGKG